jgi:outer membrane protein
MMIGVIDTDSILENYAFAVKMRNAMSKKADEMSGSLKARVTQFQNEYMDFQKKIENNAFLSRERAEQEGQRLQKKQEDLQKYQENIERTLMQEQQNIALQLKDSIDVAIKIVNKDKRFSIVLSTSSLNDNVLYVEPNLNITKEILDILNQRYNK